MSSRERFEAWHEEYLKKDIQLHTKWDVWQARDAEVARLVEALREVLASHEAEARAKLCMDTAADNYTDSRPEQDAFAKAATRSSEAEKAARALLREYDGEKRDAPTNV